MEIYNTLRKIIYLFVITCLLSCSSKNSKKEYIDTGVGLAPYALLHPKFPCTDFLKSIEDLPHIHISILWNTFGQNLSCLGEVLKNPKTRSLQIHLINETCMRKNKCGGYEIFGGRVNQYQFETYMKRKEGWIINEINAYITPVVELLKANARPGLTFYISPGLESNLGDEAANKLIEVVAPRFKGIAEIVWNPVKTYSYSTNGANYLELHPLEYNLSAPCFFNFDGTSITFPNVKTNYHQNKSYTEIPAILNKYKHCKKRYIWHNVYNCGVRSDAFVDPRQRDCVNWDGLFDKLAALVPIQEGSTANITTSIEQPTTTPTTISYANPTCNNTMGADGGGGFLWKPKADHNPNLVILLPGKFKEQFNSVYITRRDGVKEQLFFTGWSNPDHNGNRQTWRANKSGSSYKDYGIVEARDSRQICKWKIGLAKNRTD